ncbi:MAG: hypothetical protein N4A37_12700 [Prolixibacteraceae bacterium]|jgi:hypothetical protein|nr:hypothetical protein [Prolixibacteraceae bacterium]
MKKVILPLAMASMFVACTNEFVLNPDELKTESVENTQNISVDKNKKSLAVKDSIATLTNANLNLEDDPYWIPIPPRENDQNLSEDDPYWIPIPPRKNDQNLSEDDPYWIPIPPRRNDQDLSEDDPYWIPIPPRRNSQTLSEEDPYWIPIPPREQDQNK